MSEIQQLLLFINNLQVIIADEPAESLDDETAITIISCFQEMKSEGLLVILAYDSKTMCHCL